MGTERRHHLDELTIARIVRDSMSQVDRSRKLPAAARKSLSLQIASRLAEAECRATLEGISHLAGVSPPKSQDVGDAARELVQAIHARLGASLRKEADHLSLGRPAQACR